MSSATSLGKPWRPPRWSSIRHSSRYSIKLMSGQIAACWPDISLIEYLLECLMLDQRGGRHGFPSDVADDIALIYEYHALRAEKLSAGQDDTAASRHRGSGSAGPLVSPP